MADLHHYWGGDLSLSATGDLLAAEGPLRGEQRVIRRLCTNGKDALGQATGEYVFHPDYGAGLPRYIGEPAPLIQVQGITRAQMRKEPAVAHAPEPTITAGQDGIGTLTVDIQYVDVPTQTPRSLTLDLSE